MKLFFVISVMMVVAVHMLKPEMPAERKIYQAPPKGLKNFDFGYSDMIASALWVRLLQDIEICEQSQERQLPEKLTGGDSLVDQILERDMPSAQCHMGWVYRMVDVITDLRPDFYTAFETGGLFLSVLVDDRAGAHKIYQKGIAYFPDEWRLLYNAAYHALFEMQKPKEAASLLVKAGDFGAPQWAYALAANLYTKLGQAYFAKSILEEALAKNPDDLAAERIQNRLDKVNEFLSKEKSR